MADFLKITPRAAEALKPFIDQALWLEQMGLLSSPSPTMEAASFTTAEWGELIAAWRESMVEAEGITGGDLPKCG